MSTLTAKTREGKQQRSKLTELRNSGYIPGVVYGYQLEATAIAVPEKELMKAMKESGRNGVLTLNVDGNDVNVMLSDYQQDIMKGQITHADFLAVNMSNELEVKVVVTLTGESEGVKAGGILEQPNRELILKVKPSDVPESVEVDISGLQVGETLKVADIREKVKFQILDDDDLTLVTVSAPRVSEEESEDAGEEDEKADASGEAE
ncbi:50S ribosomal protein L25/general stress protein Ctc [Chungangia koreensis]|uniref:Large ribosomal subunit protein bL25 n=1 Tax=Chungangia koreensis TaxID=752657 RepID=A0ABV8X2U9_9LACT